MPYENGYYIDKRIIYQRIYGDVSLEDLDGNLQDTNKMIAEGTAPVHLICDVRQVVKFPMNVTLCCG